MHTLIHTLMHTLGLGLGAVGWTGLVLSGFTENTTRLVYGSATLVARKQQSHLATLPKIRHRSCSHSCSPSLSCSFSNRAPYGPSSRNSSPPNLALMLLIDMVPFVMPVNVLVPTPIPVTDPSIVIVFAVFL